MSKEINTSAIREAAINAEQLEYESLDGAILDEETGRAIFSGLSSTGRIADVQNAKYLSLLSPSVTLAILDQIDDYEKMKQRFQATCSHTYGSRYDGKTNNICPNCLWDKDKCQHKVSSQRRDKFCSECGQPL